MGVCILVNTINEEKLVSKEFTETIYTPESQLNRPIVLLRAMFCDLLAGRELAWRLTVRDINAQYRQTLLGIFWAFILPIANTLVWIFLNSSGIVRVGYTELPYPVFVFTGSMLWAIFIDALNAPLRKVNESKAMLAKINFPREALIISGIYETIFNGSIKIGLVLIALTLFGIYPTWNLLLFPIGFISLIICGTLIGLILTPIGLLYTDIGKAIPSLMQFYMFITPVVFPMPESGWASILFRLNPMTPIILTTRDWITGFTPKFLNDFIFVNVSIILLMMLFWVIYRLAMPILIERMSA